MKNENKSKLVNSKMRVRDKAPGISVGKVASRSGVSVQTLHFYETKGLIYSSRNSGNQRRYHRNTLRRIAVIKIAQNLGISLKEIGQALEILPKHKSPSSADWKQMSLLWREELDKGIQSLESLRDQLDSCIGCGCLSIKSCSLRNPQDGANKRGTGAVFLK